MTSHVFNLADQSCNCSNCKDLRSERDSARGENHTLQKEIKELKDRITEISEEKQALERSLEGERAKRGKLKLSIRKLKKEKEEQELKIRQLLRKNADLEKATEQASDFEKKLEKKKKKAKEAKDCCEQSEAETKAKTELQAQVDELENKLKNQSMQMSEQEKHFNEVINSETSKSDRLEKEVRRWKERPGRKCLVWLLPHCKSRYKNLDFVWDI